MNRTRLIATIATLAVAISSPAVGKPGGGGGGHGGHGSGAGPAGAGPRGGINDLGSTIRDLGRINSQGSINANPRALERSSGNSALSTDIDADAEVSTGTRIRSDRMDRRDGKDLRAGSESRISASADADIQLSDLTSGMTVVDSGGATVGTVTGIATRGNGSIRSVQVTLSNGQVINLDPSSLTLSGDVLTTASLTSTVRSQGAANASITGLANASPNSALASAGITTLTGLTTGLTVDDIGGADIGTVSGIITNRSGAVVGIQVELEGGGTVTIPATTLSMDGTTVITTFDPTP